MLLPPDLPILSTQVLPVVWVGVVFPHFQGPFGSCICKGSEFISGLAFKHSCPFDLFTRVISFSILLALQLHLGSSFLKLQLLLNQYSPSPGNYISGSKEMDLFCSLILNTFPCWGASYKWISTRSFLKNQSNGSSRVTSAVNSRILCRTPSCTC